MALLPALSFLGTLALSLLSLSPSFIVMKTASAWAPVSQLLTVLALAVVSPQCILVLLPIFVTTYWIPDLSTSSLFLLFFISCSITELLVDIVTRRRLAAAARVAYVPVLSVMDPHLWNEIVKTIDNYEPGPCPAIEPKGNRNLGPRKSRKRRGRA